MDRDRPAAPHQPQPSRRTVRLTFRVTGGEVELMSQERLEMITPPQFGDVPEAGTHGGQWLELRDASDRVLAHRLLNPTELRSVEVHSPDRRIERHFGALRDGVFEALLPDDEQAVSAVLMGEPLQPPKGRRQRRQAAGELARFELRRDNEQGG